MTDSDEIEFLYNDLYDARCKPFVDKLFTGAQFDDLASDRDKRIFRHAHWPEIGLPYDLDGAIFDVPESWIEADENDIVSARAWNAWLKTATAAGSKPAIMTPIACPFHADTNYTRPIAAIFSLTLEHIECASRALRLSSIGNGWATFDLDLRWATYSHHTNFSIFAAEPAIIATFSAAVGDLAAVKRAFDANIDFPVSKLLTYSADLLKAVVRWPAAALEGGASSEPAL